MCLEAMSVGWSVTPAQSGLLLSSSGEAGAAVADGHAEGAGVGDLAAGAVFEAAAGADDEDAAKDDDEDLAAEVDPLDTEGVPDVLEAVGAARVGRTGWRRFRLQPGARTIRLATVPWTVPSANCCQKPVDPHSTTPLARKAGEERAGPGTTAPPERDDSSPQLSPHSRVSRAGGQPRR
ncbi:hypothetical protein [Streptomyces sp. NPDC101249]|uniref:hypothetical protein n=1 Tax=Streptomyces sp. NPDC101249 TaxID=3366140 RepID=UPI0038143F1C